MIKDTSGEGAGNALTHWGTPAYVTEGLLKYWPQIAQGRVLEPSAGEGGIVKPLIAAGATVDANEARQVCEEPLKAAGCDHVWIGDFLQFPERDLAKPWHAIVANPPYRPAPVMMHHVHRALELKPTYCALLLPLSFLSGGSGRREFWRQAPPLTQVLFFAHRPKFAEAGGMFEVAWFVWALGQSMKRVAPRPPAMIEGVEVDPRQEELF